MISLQKANIGKRIISAIFDGILTAILAIGLIAVISGILNTDYHLNTYKQAYSKYSAEYNVNLTYDEYSKLTQHEKSDYNNRAAQAEEAFANDETAMYSYNMFINLSLIIITFSILISIVVIEFAVPLLFGNGQSLGKKIFGIALMHKEFIKISNMQLFTRAVLGKFAIELMIPVYIIMMIYFNSIGIISSVILLVLLIIQIVCLIATRTNSLLHDVMSGTVAVDMASQRIFDSREDLVKYTKENHSEKVGKSTF